jgi:hypothetical protein
MDACGFAEAALKIVRGDGLDGVVDREFDDGVGSVRGGEKRCWKSTADRH